MRKKYDDIIDTDKFINMEILKRYGLIDKNGDLVRKKINALNFIITPEDIDAGIENVYFGKKFNMNFEKTSLRYSGDFYQERYLFGEPIIISLNTDYINNVVFGGISCFSFQKLKDRKDTYKLSYSFKSIPSITKNNTEKENYFYNTIIYTETVLEKDPEDTWIVQVEFAHNDIPNVRIDRTKKCSDFYHYFIPVFGTSAFTSFAFDESAYPIYYTSDPNNKIITNTRILHLKQKDSNLKKYFFEKRE